ncbi:hypothetical protein CDD80_3186 [Ophiocordyceps camponoti-rufipedis]|uniref:Leucine-rich repeat-containing protein 40 n=1 Tax=Ophiocordyceps camponoti-rufipedis TaxID=2004952 RepID=A0A2C5Z2R3_9HYPO|nr:hypothetical protein CDD80_3186 [Ophiocordyceps camponoti-rufipedis]
MDSPRDRLGAVPRLSRLPVARPRLAVDHGTRGDGTRDDGASRELQPRKLRHAASMSSCAAARSRPSLSQRTIDTLSQLPSSPAMSKKPSSFFEQPPRSESRGSDVSNGCVDIRSTSLATPTPRRRSHFAHKTPRSTAPTIPARRASTASPSKLPSSVVTSTKKTPPGPPPAKAVPAKTLAARAAASKPNPNGLFKKPSLPALNRTVEKPNPTRLHPQTPVATRNGAVSPFRPTEQPGGPASLRGARSSAALRDQIAKAKAATRAAAKQQGRSAPSSEVAAPSAIFDPDATYDDPFNLRRGEDANTKVIKQRLSAARCSGRLNIAALGLKEIPRQVIHMYDLETTGTIDGSWAESVDLRRLVAADNEIKTLDDALFPDLDPTSLMDEDQDSSGGIFFGLETLDLHGNVLSGVPLGFRRLLHLTSLNLSSNRLDNDCLDVIAQIPGLKDLSLAKNHLSGPLNPVLCRLGSLEALDVHGNDITALPADMEHLSLLRTLNLSENKLGSLRFDSLAKLPLTQLLVRKNKLSGALIREPISSLPFLQTLDVSANQLTHLVPPGSSISLPVVNSVSLSMNRLQGLPDMATWVKLVTLAVQDNHISSIPESFASLGKLRHADFSSNHVRVVPPEIARMGELTTMWLRGNPLVDRKFTTISTDQLREALAVRLEPPPPYQESGDGHSAMDVDRKQKPASDWDSRSDGEDDFATPPTSAPHSPVRSPSAAGSSPSRSSSAPAPEAWPVKSGGLLERSRMGLTDLDKTACQEVARRHRVRQAQLHHNQLACIPVAVTTFSTTLVSLSLAHNLFSGSSYLTEELELAALTEINLSSNAIRDLEPLTRFLRAPSLNKMDVSRNRLERLPEKLRRAFPQLSVLLASNNQLSELEPEWIQGLKMVDVSSNEIAHLNPRIGLLGGRGGLQRLELSGNRFRTPRWTILERGTEATLQWLRGRMPVEEMALWREENGVGSDDELE